jgi:hypothetical protein
VKPVKKWKPASLQIWNARRLYHPVHARKSFEPKSGLLLAKLNMNVYIITVGSATPRINKGCPPIIECIIPHSAVDDNVCTAVSIPSTNCWNTEHHIESALHYHCCYLISYLSKNIFCVWIFFCDDPPVFRRRGQVEGE